MHRVLAVLVLGLLLAGCSKRERLNPFDPGNPFTGGRPSGFVALAGNQQMRLRWDGASTPDLLGYQIFRRVDGDSAFIPLTTLLPARTTSIGDFGLANGLKHYYRLYYVFESGNGVLPAEDFGTPGPMRPWISDGGRGSLVRVTADGRRVAFEDAAYSAPAGVAVDITGGRVWITDPGAAEVVVYDPSTTNRATIGPPLVSPSAVAVDPGDLSGWVCDPGLNQVLHFTPAGNPAVPSQLFSIDNPIDVAVDPTDRSVWVCERGADHLRHYAYDGSPIGAATVIAPSRVAVDSTTREAWVTSFTRAVVVRVSGGTTFPTPRDTVSGFQGPIGIAVDFRRGRIWVADALAGQVVALRRDGSVEFRVSGLSEVRSIAVDVQSGEAWCTVPGIGQVARLSPTGALIDAAGGLSRPDGIGLGVYAP